MNHKIIFLLCLLLSAIYCRKNFRVLRVAKCHKELNHSVVIDIKRKLVDGLDYYNMKFDVRDDLDNNNKGLGELYTIMNGKKRKIISLSLKSFCKFLIQRFGKLYVDLATEMKVPHPDRCPISKGNYHRNWSEIRFEDSPLTQIVPKGKFELGILLNSAVDDSEIMCVDARVQKV